MTEVFKLIIKWLDLFPSKYMKYYELFKLDKRSYIEDNNIAVAAAGTELILILDHCFRKHDRIQKISKSLELTGEESETNWYFTKSKNSNYRIALCHTFGTLGGFDAIIRF